MAFLEKTVAVNTTDTDLYVCPATLSGSVHGLTFSNITGVQRTVTLKVFSQLSGLTTQITSSGQVIPADGQFTWPKPINMVAGDKIIASADVVSSVVAVVAVYLDQAAMPSSAFVPRGTWSSLANYSVNDVVVAGDGTSYLAIADSLNSSPPSASWMVLSLKGAEGTGVTSQTVGFTATGGATPKTLTVDVDLVASGVATKAGVESLTNKTITDIVFALTGTTPAFTATNGSVQTWTLTANSTPTNSLTTGQSIILVITPGAYTITWPTVVWTKQGGSGAAPALFSAGKTSVVLWMVGAVLYGSHLGDTV